ncbi:MULTISPECIES: hypothetical protein [unclassified Brevundimonas]|uniref:hypothetical protein n=1 Tax=unclassified Brevundimonas TaxID=2622653 RepID=UPI000AAE74A7|nr:MULTISPECIES: hypothetical protein [unclassified Brevundimonas]
MPTHYAFPGIPANAKTVAALSLLSSSSGERSETGGPGGAEGDLFTHAGLWLVCGRVALARAAGSPGLRREGAACRRMTKG